MINQRYQATYRRGRAHTLSPSCVHCAFACSRHGSRVIDTVWVLLLGRYVGCIARSFVMWDRPHLTLERPESPATHTTRHSAQGPPTHTVVCAHTSHNKRGHLGRSIYNVHQKKYNKKNNALHATQHGPCTRDSRQRSEVPLLRPVLLAIIEDELLAREHAPNKKVSK